MSNDAWPDDLTPEEKIRFEVVEWCLQEAERDGYANLARAGRRFGVSRPAVSKWVDRFEAEGWAGLRTRTRVTSVPALSDDDLVRLRGVLEAGAIAAGYRDDLWTLPRIAEVIKSEFGVRYHPAHVSRILRHRMGFSSQRPQRVAKEKDAERAEAWLTEEWPRIKGGPESAEPPSSS